MTAPLETSETRDRKKPWWILYVIVLVLALLWFFRLYGPQ